MRQFGPVVCSFKFLCSKEWNELSEIEGQDSIRFCDACESPVFLCDGYSELAEHIKKSHCIALVRPEEGKKRVGMHLVGMPVDISNGASMWDDDIPF